MSVVPEASDAVTERHGSWDSHTDALLGDFHNRVSAAREAHYLLASRCRRRNVMLGVPVVVCSSMVGTSLFATLTQDTVSSPLRAVIGGVSVLAAVLAALQTFLRFSERAERHVQAGDWYSAVRRDTAVVLALPWASRDEPRDYLDRLRKEMSKIGQQSPEISDRVWAAQANKHEVDESPPARRPRPGRRDGQPAGTPADVGGRPALSPTDR